MINDFNFLLKSINFDEHILSAEENDKAIIINLLQRNSDNIIAEINSNFYINYKMFVYLLLAEKALETDYKAYYNIYLQSPISAAKQYIKDHINHKLDFQLVVRNLCTKHHLYSLPMIYKFKRIVKDIVNAYFYKLRILNIAEVNQIIKLMKQIIYDDNLVLEDIMLNDMFKEAINYNKGE